MRDHFATKFGFVLAAAGSAVGLGNIWGFPTQVANHGGGAFIVVYLLVVVVLAIPALYTELSLGQAAQANPVQALGQLSQRGGAVGRAAGRGMGYLNIIGALLMLSFYHVVAGWMLAQGLAALAHALGLELLGGWLANSSRERDVLMLAIFLALTFAVVRRGISGGIERWAKRLMPLLLLLLLGLIGFIATLPGASAGFAAYLTPNFSALHDPQVVVAAMGQAFFSLSIGLGGMLIYASYLAPGTRLGKLTLSVAGVDTLVALLAGLLVIPALYVAMAQGMVVSQEGALVGEGQLIFQVLPELFNKLGTLGAWLGAAFFALLCLAALTSTIAVAEIPIAYAIEHHHTSRARATIIMATVVSLLALLLVFAFDPLFGMVVSYVTKFQLPLSGLFYFLVIGWLWTRSNRLRERARSHWRERLLFWHLRIVCPLLLGWVFIDVAWS